MHRTSLSVHACLHVNVHIHAGKILPTNPHTILFSQFFFPGVFLQMSVVEVSSPTHECWMKKDTEIGFPTAQGTNF